MQNIAAFFALFFGVLALSTSAIFVKLAAAPSGITAFYRLLFATLALLPFVLGKAEHRRELMRLSAREWRLCALAGVLLAIHYIMWFESLRYTSVASSTVLVSLQPLFSIVIGRCCLGERQNGIALGGCFVAIIGSFIIGYGDFQTGSSALFGDCIAVLAAGVIAVYFFIGQILRRNISASLYSALGYGCSVAALAVYALARGEDFFNYPASTWQAFLGLALVSTIMGQFIFNLLLKWVSAATISMGILGEPVGTCVLAYFILGEVIDAQQGAGICLILTGLALYFLSRQIAHKLVKFLQ